MKGQMICSCGNVYDNELPACPVCDLSEMWADEKPFNPLWWTYDLETYPNIITASFKHLRTGVWEFFEISERKNQLTELLEFLGILRLTKCTTIGFNNIGFDYPIIHFIIENCHLSLTYNDIYHKAQSIIDTSWTNRFSNVIPEWHMHILQIDLSKVHHFDNENRHTSLKMLEFNMRSHNIQDLPFTPAVPLELSQMNALCEYNNHDVNETEKFLIKTIPMLDFREEMGKRYDANFLNFSDKKIGTELFIRGLEAAQPGSCFTKNQGERRQPRQTWRDTIALKDVVLPYISFAHPEFNRIHQWFKAQVITETKGVFLDLYAMIDGFKYVFGVGGIHGSIESSTVCTDDNAVLYDWDVAGYYPSIGAANGLFPEHLSNQFSIVDAELKAERAKHKKGTPLNKAIKLARNGAYGDSNSQYSPFYDPQYTMSITINGQLLLCMLAEQLIKIPGLKMIQINTDGMTVKCPRTYVDHMKNVCKWWEDFTRLELESVVYKRMFIRDVNNYIGEYEDGKLKRKGAYEYELEWHQNHSALIVPKIAEKVLLRGCDIEKLVHNHNDPFDFMLRTKVGRSDELLITHPLDGIEEQLQKITRYYIAVDGGTLSKRSPPKAGCILGDWKRKNSLTDQYYKSVKQELRLLHPDDKTLPWDERINTKNKSVYEIRNTSYNAGRLVAPCNNMDAFNWGNIDYNYYINEVHKLVDALQ